MLRGLLKVALIIILSGAVGAGVSVAVMKLTPPPPAELPANPPETEIELLGVTPEGVKLYRIKHPKGIVPTIVGLAPNGSIAIR